MTFLDFLRLTKSLTQGSDFYVKQLQSGNPAARSPCWNDHLVITTTFFQTKRKKTESFYYSEDTVDAATSLLRPGFYGSTVVH